MQIHGVLGQRSRPSGSFLQQALRCKHPSHNRQTRRQSRTSNVGPNLLTTSAYRGLGFRVLTASFTQRIATRAGRHDPWGTLGLPQGSDEPEIKRAYRQLVLRTHPDHHGNDPAAQERFIDIQQAYEVLVARARGKAAPSSGDNSWEFHDWFWNFNRERKWAKKGAASGAPPKAAAQTAQPGQLDQQLAGLRRKAAFRRAKQGASASPADPAEQHHHASSPDHAPTSRLELAGSYHTALGVAPSSNSVKSCAAGSASGGPLSPHPPAAQPAPLSSQPCASEHAAHSHANAASALVDPAPAGLGVRLEPVPYSRADVALAASLGAFLSSQLWQQSGLAPKTREPAAMSEAVALAV